MYFTKGHLSVENLISGKNTDNAVKVCIGIPKQRAEKDTLTIGVISNVDKIQIGKADDSVPYAKGSYGGQFRYYADETDEKPKVIGLPYDKVTTKILGKVAQHVADFAYIDRSVELMNSDNCRRSISIVDGSIIFDSTFIGVVNGEVADKSHAVLTVDLIDFAETILSLKEYGSINDVLADLGEFAKSSGRAKRIPVVDTVTFG